MKEEHRKLVELVPDNLKQITAAILDNIGINCDVQLFGDCTVTRPDGDHRFPAITVSKPRDNYVRVGIVVSGDNLMLILSVGEQSPVAWIRPLAETPVEAVVEKVREILTQAPGAPN